MTTLIICLTVIFCVVYITQWAKRMAIKQLPHLTIGHLAPKSEPPVEMPEPKIGFTAEPNEPVEEKLSDQAQLDQILRDTASTVTALINGEVDFDDIRR